MLRQPPLQVCRKTGVEPIVFRGMEHVDVEGVPLETFFHKIVMIRNDCANSRAEDEPERQMSEADKFDHTSRAVTDRSPRSTSCSKTSAASSVCGERD